jgi:hypothetical protein
MELVKCATFPGCRLAIRWSKKRLDVNPARNMKVEIRRAVVYVSQLGCEGELELLTAIQVYA